jgi:tripartite-type tricarboxylate transporter receptor subunit TctC
VVAAINAIFGGLLKHSEVIRKMAAQSAEPVGGAPADYAAFVARESQKWSDVVREAGIKPS